MDIHEAREKAAQCWCTPDTANRVMDAELAEAFAQLLVEETEEPKLFVMSRRVMRAEFRADPDLRFGYVSNIAMLLHDQHGVSDVSRANAMADDVMRLVFESN